MKSYDLGKTTQKTHFSDEELTELIQFYKSAIDFLDGRGESQDTVYALQQELNMFEGFRDERKRSLNKY